MNDVKLESVLHAVEVAIKFRKVQYGDKTAVSGTLSEVLQDAEQIFRFAIDVKDRLRVSD